MHPTGSGRGRRTRAGGRRAGSRTCARPRSSLTAALGFAAVALAVYGSAVWILPLLADVEDAELVARGLTLDLVVLVPLAYYALLVRNRHAPTVSLLPVLLLSFAATSALLPPRHHGLLSALSTVLPLCELALAIWVAVRIRRAVRLAGSRDAVDVPERIRHLLEGLIDVPFVARALAYELSLAYFALRPPRRAPLLPGELSHHRSSGYGVVVGILLMVAGAELFGIHLLLVRWSATAALLHVLISLYGVVWLLGDYRALRARRHRATDDGLEIRVGLRWSLDIPWEAVAGVRKAFGPRPDELDGYLAAVPLGSIQYLLTLARDVEAVGPYGITRAVRRVGLSVDDRNRFEALLAERGIDV